MGQILQFCRTHVLFQRISRRGQDRWKCSFDIYSPMRDNQHNQA